MHQFFKTILISCIWITHSAHSMHEESLHEQSLIEATKIGNINFVRYHLQKIEAIQNRLQKDLNNVDFKDKSGNTALSHAASCGYTEILKLLIKAGATIDTTNIYGNTPLIRATDALPALLSEPIMLSLIEAGADVNHRGNKGITALMCATSQGRIKNVQILLDAKARLLIKDTYGNTALTGAFTKRLQWQNAQENIITCCELIIDRLMKIPNHAQVEKVFVILKAIEKQYGYDCKEHVRPFLHAAIEEENREFPEESIAFREIRCIHNDEYREIFLKKYTKNEPPQNE